MILAAISAPAAAGTVRLTQADATSAHAPRGPLNTLDDIRIAIAGCWQWPPVDLVVDGIELSLRISFKRNGEILSARITYESQLISASERVLYHRSLINALTLCSPLPITDALGNAIAGRPFLFHFQDTRRQRKA
jgi:hypothetical protein